MTYYSTPCEVRQQIAEAQRYAEAHIRGADRHRKGELTMPIVQFHLKRSHEQLCLATSNLQDALCIAKSMHYGIERTHPIATALARTKEALRHAERAADANVEREVGDGL